jgi:RHS repeat-associated protein
VPNYLVKTFNYSPASEISSETRSNTAFAFPTGQIGSVNRGYATNALNQYTAAGTTSLTYGPRGNLATSDGNYYCHNSENRLYAVGTSANCAALTASLAYDPVGRLSSVTAGGTTTAFAYDGVDLIAEYSGSTLTNRYVFGPAADEPIVSYDAAGNRTWLTSDERGSIIARVDSNGNVTAINSYDEYGIPASTNSGRFQYTGQVYLPQVGMYYYKNRMYSTTLGRFIETDPIGYGDGLNWYAYVHNQPINKSDPMGLCGGPNEGPCPIIVTGPSSRNPSTICNGNCENDTASQAPIDNGLERGDDGSAALNKIAQLAMNTPSSRCAQLDKKVQQAQKAYQAADPDMAGFYGPNFSNSWDSQRSLDAELTDAKSSLSSIQVLRPLAQLERVFDNYSAGSAAGHAYVKGSKATSFRAAGAIGLAVGVESELADPIGDVFAAATGNAGARFKSLEAKINLLQARKAQLSAEQAGTCSAPTARG